MQIKAAKIKISNHAPNLQQKKTKMEKLTPDIPITNTLKEKEGTTYMRLYHNPRCSKSRQALALLHDRGLEVEVHLYLEEGILADDLDVLSKLEGIVRSKEAGKAIMAELTSSEAVKNLLRTQPKVLERPVLIHKGAAIIGRPPEDILALVE